MVVRQLLGKVLLVLVGQDHVLVHLLEHLIVLEVATALVAMQHGQHSCARSTGRRQNGTRHRILQRLEQVGRIHFGRVEQVGVDLRDLEIVDSSRQKFALRVQDARVARLVAQTELLLHLGLAQRNVAHQFAALLNVLRRRRVVLVLQEELGRLDAPLASLGNVKRVVVPEMLIVGVDGGHDAPCVGPVLVGLIELGEQLAHQQQRLRVVRVLWTHTLNEQLAHLEQLVVEVLLNRLESLGQKEQQRLRRRRVVLSDLLHHKHNELLDAIHIGLLLAAHA
mmetsp:Transcript_39209/g.64158  ORF Transcript_39209/g.64158 Transcript_39209/m.64158 type:complete len:280 (+) Transcript_39209:474-1313(+)